MYKMRPVHVSKPVTQAMLVMLLLSLTFMTAACGGDPQTQQQASQNKAHLDQTLQHAQQIGIPASLLNPILKQEQQLSNSGAPFSPFNDQPVTDYYKNQANQYAKLLTQAQGIISTATDQYQLQAQNDVQAFQKAIGRRTAQKMGNLAPFIEQYNTAQTQLSSAKYPKDYAVISQESQKALEALGLMGLSDARLKSFKNTINQMHQARIDVTAMTSEYQSDLTSFNNATQSADFQTLNTLLDAQYQLAVVNSIAALPYVSASKLSEFKAQITLLKTYQVDASSYQKLYQQDQAAIQRAKTMQDFLAFSSKIDADMASMHDDLIQGASNYFIGQLDHEARAWGQAHLFHDKTDGQNYILDSGYTTDGIGYWLNRELGWAYTPDDFQSVINEEKDQFFNLHIMEQDYNDKTPYNQVHATDRQMMQHYHLKGTILMVSMVEQALRFYQDGKLIKSFYVTTGRVERPSLPGVWTTQDRKSPTVFKSDEPKNSPFWYPDTPIHYAILYHWGGYNVHDAWWRATFGPGTQFPHDDAAGTDSFNGNGSHGCVNMQEDEAAWVYDHTDSNTTIVIY